MKSSITKPTALNAVIATSQSQVIDLDGVSGVSVHVVSSDVAPTAKTFTSATNEVDTLSFPAKSGATNGDYVALTDTNGAKWAVALSTAGIAEVTSITAIAEGSVAERTQIVCTDATSLHTKYFVLKDEVGTVAFWIDLDDAGGSAPVHGCDRAVEITTVATGMTAGQVGTAVYNAIHADSKFNSVSDDTAGTIIVVSTTYGNKTGQSAGDSGFTVTENLAGVASSLTGKYFKLADASGVVAFWIDVGNEGTSQPTVSGANRYVEITTVNRGDTNAQVAAAVRTAIDNDSKFDVGTLSTATFTATCKDLKSVTDSAAGDSGFTVTKVTNGADLGAEPTGAIWTAIAAGKKSQVDISGCTDASSVATAVQTTLAALTGIGAVLTIGSASVADIPVTHVATGPVANPVPKNADDSGAGSITVAETTAGLVTTLSLTANTMTISAHGYITGTKVAATTAGVLPTGLTATNYWIIKVDANTVQLAASLADAVASPVVPVDLTGEGSGTHTLTPAAANGNVLKLQKSNDQTNWIDVTSMSQTIATAAVNAMWEISMPSYRYARVLYTPSAGQINLEVTTNQVTE